MEVINADVHEEEWRTAHKVPNFEIPVGWFENQSMRKWNGSQMSIRSEDWRYHIDISGVTTNATIDGPYWAELKVQVGGSDSFETKRLRRLTGIEPGGIQDAVYLLVGQAIEHEMEE